MTGSLGMEHVYVQEWLTDLLGSDPIIQAGPTQGRIGESPIAANLRLPAIAFRATPESGAAELVGFGRGMITFVYAIEVTALTLNVGPLLKTANRMDVLLTRPETSRNITFTASDGSTLRIKGITRDRPYTDTVIEEGTKNALRMLGGEYRIRCAVELTGDVLS